MLQNIRDDDTSSSESSASLDSERLVLPTNQYVSDKDRRTAPNRKSLKNHLDALCVGKELSDDSSVTSDLTTPTVISYSIQKQITERRNRPNKENLLDMNDDMDSEHCRSVVYDKQGELRKATIEEESADLTQKFKELDNLIEETKKNYYEATMTRHKCITICKSFEEELKSTYAVLRSFNALIMVRRNGGFSQSQRNLIVENDRKSTRPVPPRRNPSNRNLNVKNKVSEMTKAPKRNLQKTKSSRNVPERKVRISKSFENVPEGKEMMSQSFSVGMDFANDDLKAMSKSFSSGMDMDKAKSTKSSSRKSKNAPERGFRMAKSFTTKPSNRVEDVSSKKNLKPTKSNDDIKEMSKSFTSGMDFDNSKTSRSTSPKPSRTTSRSKSNDALKEMSKSFSSGMDFDNSKPTKSSSRKSKNAPERGVRMSKSSSEMKLDTSEKNSKSTKSNDRTSVRKSKNSKRDQEREERFNESFPRKLCAV